ncbi:ABC transporter substrate-binding protein [Stygiolobus caldivivus]|uniref:Extracellular solute-binding protein n=1 Tax=Stygiolobus caldivivus TaxID=2824673 RepID=A0A8D5U9S7_9CREN|nr:ABC transporter substrate-binding protein [Stygiolobus caldivivus]BCU71542.1 hypothetical protein KN1_28390 [Stygiolobus caldivivus]
MAFRDFLNNKKFSNKDIKLRRAISGAALIAIIVVAALVVALGVYFYMSSVKPTTTTSSTITITYFDDLAPSEAKVMQTVVIPMFEKQHPNIKINYVDESASQIVQSIESLEQAGKIGPTIIGEDNMVIGELIYGGYLMNLSPIASQMMPSSLIPSMVTLTNYEIKVWHAIYFIPLRANIPLVFYNKQALEQVGFTQPPQNLSALMEASELLYQKTGVKPVMFQGHGGASTATELFQWAVQFGGNPIVFNDSGDIQMFEYLYNLSNYFAPAYIHGYWGSYKGLASGEYYILDYQWPYVYSLLQGLGMNSSTLGVYPGPAGPVNSDHLVGGDVLAIPKGVPSKDLPYLIEFAKFLLSSEVQRIFIVNLGWPAVNAKAYENLPSNISYLYQQEEAALQHSFFRPPVPWITEWNNIMDHVFDQIIVDHAPYSQIPQILSQANAQMYQYLAKYYGPQVAQQYEQGDFGPLYA